MDGLGEGEWSRARATIEAMKTGEKTGDKGTESRRQERRRRTWLPGGLQSKIGAATYAVAAIALMLSLQIGMLGLYWVFTREPTTVEEALQMIKGVLLVQFVVLAVAVGGFAYWAGRTFFRVAGPLYRIRAYFASLVDGRWDVACDIRTTDHLHDLKDSINEGLKPMTARLRSQHDALSAAHELLERLRENGEADSIAPLLERIDAERAEYARRFGESAPDEANETTEHDAVAATEKTPSPA